MRPNLIELWKDLSDNEKLHFAAMVKIDLKEIRFRKSHYVARKKTGAPVCMIPCGGVMEEDGRRRP